MTYIDIITRLAEEIAENGNHEVDCIIIKEDNGYVEITELK